MKIYNTKEEASKDLAHGQKIDKTAFVQRVWNGTRHVYAIRVGHDKWFAGVGAPPTVSKQSEDPEPKRK